MKSLTRVFIILVIASLLASGCGAPAAATPVVAQPATPVPTSIPTVLQPTGMVTIKTKIDFNTWPRAGTFEVSEGANILGCSAGSFVDMPVEPKVQKRLTCKTGTRSGTFTVEFTAEEDNPGPGDENGSWNTFAATEDLIGLSGRGDFSVVVDEVSASGVETLTGEIEYSP